MNEQKSGDGAATHDDDAAVPETAALLVVRAWVEGPSGRFMARITTVADLPDGDQQVRYVSTVDNVMLEVRKWLDEVSPG